MGGILSGHSAPQNEAARTEALRVLDIVSSPADPALDSIVAVAAEYFKVPIVFVSLLDESRQWIIASGGIDIRETEREIAFCNYAFASGELFVVNDARADHRFKDNPLVTDGPRIRFYAGAPLCVDPDVRVGTLCICDTEPRQFTGGEAHQLKQMAEVVEALIRRHRDRRTIARFAVEMEERNRLIGAQAGALARYNRVFDRASIQAKLGAWERNLATDEMTCTAGIYDLYELPQGSPIDRTWLMGRYAPDDQVRLQLLLDDPAPELGALVFEAQITTAKGNKRWVRSTFDVEFETGVSARRCGITQDITDQKAIWDRMRFLAECDPLTGLPNRSMLQKKLSEANQSDSGDGSPFALLLIDLDGFKHLNDTFGHPVGDECIKRLGARLRGVFGEAELVVRLGGDEFAVLLADARDLRTVEACAARILSELRRPVKWKGQSFQLSGSIGVARSNGAAAYPSQLFTEADMALYAAKAGGRNTFRFFTPDMKNRADARSKTIRDITSALAERELELFYQPKIDLRDDSLSGFEALLRWRRPDGQVIAAGAFAAALEDPELSGDIGKWVIEAALSQAQNWRKAGLAFGHIAINLSSSQFNQRDFADSLLRKIEERGLRPEMIEVEVTEGVSLSERAIVRQTLDTLKAAGIRIALDDFGTGYASLTHLKAFPIDIIKIDRSFVQHALTSPQDNAILQSTLFLAERLNLDVVAEGIEQADQCSLLKGLNCRFGQGYLFARPLSVADATRWCTPIEVGGIAA